MAPSLLVRGASLLLSAFLLLPAFAAAAGSTPLGTLRSDGAVYVDSAPVPSRSTLFSGDRVATGDGRAMLSLPHGSSLMLDRATSAAVRNSSEGLTIGLEFGRVTFSSDPRTALQVEAGGLALAPNGSFPSVAEVAMLADGSLSLAVRVGAVAVRNLRREPIVVQAGKSITVGPPVVQKDQTPGTAAHGSKPIGHTLRTFKLGGLSHGASVAVVGGVVAGVAAGVTIPLVVNDEPAAPASPVAP